MDCLILILLCCGLMVLMKSGYKKELYIVVLSNKIMLLDLGIMVFLNIGFE